MTVLVRPLESYEIIIIDKIEYSIQLYRASDGNFYPVDSISGKLLELLKEENPEDFQNIIRLLK